MTIKTTRKGLFIYAPLMVLAFFSKAAHADDSSWIRHRGFETFQQGTAGDGGENLYVSRRGRVQAIRRLDLNVDGEIYLLNKWFSR